MTPLEIIRRRKLLTMRQLAEHADVALSTIYLLEAGRTTRPRRQVVEAICAALRVRPGQVDEFRPVARKTEAATAKAGRGHKPDAQRRRHTLTEEP